MTCWLTGWCAGRMARRMLRLNRRLLAKLVRLSRHEWAELLLAQVAVLHAQLLVWTRPRGWLVTPSASPVAPARGGAEIEPAAQQLALAVGRVAGYGPWRPSCLVRAVALHRALESRGLGGSSVCVG